MENYKLVNPYVKGSINLSAKGADEVQAAGRIWTNLSKNFEKNLPKFAFSIERVSDGKLYHFLVKETITNQDVNFKISELDNIPEKNNNILKNKIKNLTGKSGGANKKNKRQTKRVESQEKPENKPEKKSDKKSKDKSSSSSSSSSESDFSSSASCDFDRCGLISHIWYEPIIYDIPSLYIPTFIPPISPYVELATQTIYLV